MSTLGSALASDASRWFPCLALVASFVLGLRPSSLVAPFVPGHATLRLQLFVLGSGPLPLAFDSRPSFLARSFFFGSRLRSRSSVSCLRSRPRPVPSLSAPACAFALGPGLCLRSRPRPVPLLSAPAFALALSLCLRSLSVRDFDSLFGLRKFSDVLSSCHRGIMAFGLRGFWFSWPLRVLFALNCHPAVWLLLTSFALWSSLRVSVAALGVSSLLVSAFLRSGEFSTCFCLSLGEPTLLLFTYGHGFFFFSAFLVGRLCTSSLWLHSRSFIQFCFIRSNGLVDILCL